MQAEPRVCQQCIHWQRGFCHLPDWDCVPMFGSSPGCKEWRKKAVESPIVFQFVGCEF